MTTATTTALQVAVIGAGAAGLAAARALSRRGIIPTVLEQESSTGGVWDYNVSTNKKKKPMYRNLRTNLPKEVMAYREKKWKFDEDTPPKSFVTHEEVLNYLNEYKSDFGLDRFIQYNSKVTQLTILENSSILKVPEESGSVLLPQIRLEWECNTKKTSKIFDAVCIANGHYAKPSIPSNLMSSIENDDESKKVVTTMHSMEYDDPNDFVDQTVLCIGARASGSDLARELSYTARQVYLSCENGGDESETNDNVTRVPRTRSIRSDGTVEFEGDDASTSTSSTIQVDTIIYCTGYEYNFPFLNDQSQVVLNKDEKVEVVHGERRVQNVYKHLWHATIPNLSFVGLPHSVVPFPLFELQSEAVVSELLKWNDNNNDNNDSMLPNRSDRIEAAAIDATCGGAKKTGRIQDTHFLGGGAQWEYCRDMAKIAQLYDDELEHYISTNQAIYEHSSGERKHLLPGGADTYRETSYTRDDTGFEVVDSCISPSLTAQ